jgi:acyl-CoA reductase-like NAD-dependent aldehyde dehydrogenase
MTVLDPNSGTPLAGVCDVGAAGVDEAVAAARGAQAAWAGLEPRARGAALFALADLVEREAERFARVEAADVGKPVGMTPPEIASAIDKIRFYAGASRLLSGSSAGSYRLPYMSYQRREPVGIVAALSPWNYPFALAIWKIIPALAAGNTVVLKPSPETPLSTLLLGHLAAQVLPPGVLNVIVGGPETGAALVRHRDVATVSLTGGTATGKAVMRTAADSLKRLVLELGGNAPVVLFDDADLERFREGYFMAMFRNTGQDCHAASRVYAPHGMVDRVAAVIADVIAHDARVGDNWDTDVTVGPLVSAAQQDRIAALVDRAVAEPGVERAVGGNRPDGAGFFYPPTLLLGVAQDAEIVQQETFGPVVTVTPFADERQAVEFANGTAFGLGGSVWSRSIDRAIRVAEALRVGTVWVNGHGATIAEMPFGGVKESGFGKDLGLAAMEQYTDVKHIAVAIDRSPDSA